jgi:tight adherence protein B
MTTPTAVAPSLVALLVVVVAARHLPHAHRARFVAGADPPAGEPGWWRGRWARPRRRAGDVEVAEWCEHVARSLRGGSSLSRAFDDAALAVPVAAREFDELQRALRRGRSLPAALATIDADPTHAVGLVAPVLQACADLGGPAAAPLDRVAATLQARAAARAERATASAQARMSARVLTTLPVGMLLLLATADASVRTTLTTPAGTACLVAGSACNAAGWWWMRRITDGGGP